MKSVDAGIVQQMFGEDITLFKSLLGRMLKDYADLALPVPCAADDEVHRRVLGDRAHKLKGSAGMIGATQVMRYAGALERVLHEGRSAEVIDANLRKLSVALTTLREESADMLGAETPMRMAAEFDAAGLEELKVLLETQNLAAVDQFAALSPALAAILDAARFESLQRAVDDLDFQTGADLLRDAQVMPDGHRQTCA
jgi:HPt (histidine-containing phosphotransfer) domain-containing protein